jgi:hypothetical protein
MNIQNWFNTKMVDENGYLTPEYQVFFQDLITQLQQNLSNQGFQLPQQPTAKINYISSVFAASPNPNVYYGNIIYDTTTDQAKLNVAGTYKVIQVV